MEREIVNNDANPIENEIGTPINSKIKKLEHRTITLDQSILFTFNHNLRLITCDGLEIFINITY